MLPLRLQRLSGQDDRMNDTLFHPATLRTTIQHTLVFFGGDVQDYPEVMQAHRDNRNYLQWNLERTARQLARSFPNQHILVVRPSRVELKSFSCYDNFVPNSSAGVPEHTATHHALRHLERLLQSVSVRLKQTPTTELLEAVSSLRRPDDNDTEQEDRSASPSSPETSSNGAVTSAAAHKPEEDPLWWLKDISLDHTRLTLVGFSKGCVVLNQLIYEFHYTNTLTPGDGHTIRFMERVSSMYWLDGGHAGGKNTWLTARSLLETLARLGVNIYIHVSPYQVKDEARPWIGREEKTFTGLLRKLGAKVSRYLHAGSPPYSLLTHFSVLDNFKRVQDSAPLAAPDASDEES